MTKINDDWLYSLLCFCFFIVPVTYVTSCMLPFTVKLELINNKSIYSSLSSSSLVPLLLSSSINICILIRLCSPCFPTICMCHVACCFLVISVYIMSRFCSNVVCVLCHIALTLYLNLCCFQALEKVNRQMSHYTQFFFFEGIPKSLP